MEKIKKHLNINKIALAKLHKKYFIHRKKSTFAKKIERLQWQASRYLLGVTKHHISQKKFSRVPKKFYRAFDQMSYLLANPDIQESIDKNKFETALEHFVFFGYEEVQKGVRRIGSEFPHFSEKSYLSANPDVKWGIEEGKFSSAFEHFLLFGYEEFLLGNRELPGSYPFEWSQILKKHVQSYFDSEAYLEVNPDVAEGIKRGEFVNAWEHFELLGLEEVRRGERTLHSNIPKYSERVYVLHYPDIFDEKKYGQIASPFEHFLRYGAQEILEGTRTVKGSGIYSYEEPKYTGAIEYRLKNFKYTPIISVVMPVYNVEVKWLELAIKSLHSQWYTNWELCIADDASTNVETVTFLKTLKDPKIKVKFLKNNVHISEASNEAFSLASGDYIALMDHDDEFTVDALYEVVKEINVSNAAFIYSDEDKISFENGNYIEPHFKPDFSPDMFLSQNYLSHLSVIKKSLIEEAGGWTTGLEGSQDYDLYLKVLEKIDQVTHIPKVLYHWRKVPGSTAVAFSDKSYAQEAGKKALKYALKRRKLDAEVLYGKYPGTYRVKYALEEKPLVSIVIPFKDKPELLEMCIHSILKLSTYINYEIIAINNKSQEEATFQMMKLLQKKDERVHFYDYNKPFNYAAINNYAVKTYAKGEQIILLNNDIEIITPEWIESLLEFSQRKDVGVVGAKLYYPDDTIQHAGVSIGVLALAGHNFRHTGREQPGYMARTDVIQNVSAVTAACLMVKKDLYLDMNGLNESDLKIAFNDIDFCLRLRELGYLNVYTPYCEAYHYESVSRGLEDTAEKLARFNKEVAYMKTKHQSILEKGDPYYNPNLTLEREDFAVL